MSDETAVPRSKVLVFAVDRPLPAGLSAIPKFVSLAPSGQPVKGYFQIMSDRLTIAFFSSTPMDGNINVSQDMILFSYWNRPMDETTLNENSVKLLDSAGNQIPCTIRYVPFWHRLDLIPIERLEAGSTYPVSLGSGLRNLRGQEFGSPPPW